MCTKNTEDVADCFPELLLALVSMAISTDNIQSSTLLDKDVAHRLNAVILGKLIVINEDLLTYVFLEYMYYMKIACIKLLTEINLVL